MHIGEKHLMHNVKSYAKKYTYCEKHAPSLMHIPFNCFQAKVVADIFSCCLSRNIEKMELTKISQ